MAAFVVKGISDQSEILVWVRAVASALIAGVVVKLLLFPSGALALIPGFVRLLAVLIGIAGFFLFRRSVLAGLILGEIALIMGGYLTLKL
jgi:Branched-chain amino acid transport protein (AzlD)